MSPVCHPRALISIRHQFVHFCLSVGRRDLYTKQFNTTTQYSRIFGALRIRQIQFTMMSMYGTKLRTLVVLTTNQHIAPYGRTTSTTAARIRSCSDQNTITATAAAATRNSALSPKGGRPAVVRTVFGGQFSTARPSSLSVLNVSHRVSICRVCAVVPRSIWAI